MSRTRVQGIRRQALIEAAIESIHERGSIDVTVGQIARRAGVSSALAHHYFGAKDDLIVATMRHLLSVLSEHLRGRLRAASDPRERISAIITGSFTADQMQPAVMSAWLIFYAMARGSPRAARLHRAYSRRLNSNLVAELARLVPVSEARRIAEGTAALIDGIYLRCALADRAAAPEAAVACVEDYVTRQLAGRSHA